ncbi:MAG: dockerin type I repeat-containing protein [Clostridiales bacterium]|nr:dockerin type I repeat-containing protein [Clostridiales bacterium]
MNSKIIGDVNDDGYITVADVTLVQKASVKLTTFTEEQNTLADVNGDGRISMLDATCIQKYVVGGYSDTGLVGQTVTV